MPRVIALANHKGGVGKTTTAVNLGASLAIAEKRTLVIDLDPQGNASRGLGAGRVAPRASIYEALLDLTSVGQTVLRSLHLPLLDVIPATPSLAGAAVELHEMPDPLLQLRRVLRPLRQEFAFYDYILIDCPPSMGVLVLNAFAAADSVLIPVQPEFWALEGFIQLIKSLREVQETINPRIDVEGVLLTLFDRRLGLARQVEQELRRTGYRVFHSVIPRNVALAEAPGHEQPVALYSVASPGAQAYLSLAREICGDAAAGRQMVAV
jgi:chromosome partitioning protein